MSREHVQLVVGRLILDEVFRRKLERGGSAYLASLRAVGVALTRTEIATLIAIDPRVWKRVAAQIDIAREGSRPVPPPDGHNLGYRSVTEQQQQVLARICDGWRNRDIAAELGISEGAVKATIQQLFRRFSVRRRVQLVRLALSGSIARALTTQCASPDSGPALSEPTRQGATS